MAALSSAVIQGAFSILASIPRHSACLSGRARWRPCSTNNFPLDRLTYSTHCSTMVTNFAGSGTPRSTQGSLVHRSFCQKRLRSTRNTDKLSLQHDSWKHPDTQQILLLMVLVVLMVLMFLMVLMVLSGLSCLGGLNGLTGLSGLNGLEWS